MVENMKDLRACLVIVAVNLLSVHIVMYSTLNLA